MQIKGSTYAIFDTHHMQHSNMHRDTLIQDMHAQKKYTLKHMHAK
jgi:hypothetical protein